MAGATTQSEISGVTDNKYPNDQACLDAIKKMMDKIGDFEKAGFNREKAAPPAKEPKDIFGLLPGQRSKPYDSLEIIERLVDKSDFQQYKEGYGQTILCGYARIDGWAVGIVANNRKITKK